MNKKIIFAMLFVIVAGVLFFLYFTNTLSNKHPKKIHVQNNVVAENTRVVEKLPGINSPLAIVYSGSVIYLLKEEREVDLEKILGKPLSDYEVVERSVHDHDSFARTKKIFYPGLELVFFGPEQYEG